MPTLDETLDYLITCLENPSFRSYGDIMKSKFQHSKPEEDKELRRDMYKGIKVDPKKVEKQKASYRKKTKEQRKESMDKAAKLRSNWYKDPENYRKFKESLKKRDLKKKTKN